MKKSSLVLVIVLLVVGCTSNQSAKDYGGTAELTLPQGEKLLEVTWKDADLWYLTRPMTAADSAVTYTFKEKSTYGIWSGTYIIHEQK